MNELDSARERMRQDWDHRAREDASYYVAFGRRSQDPEEFFSSAADVLRSLREEYRRFGPGVAVASLSAFEIGCGPGRLLLPLSKDFGHVTGVDVSGEMVALARENLGGVANAEVHQCSGADLADFADASVDFCYSYAVFQHIPQKAVVWSYLREACRILRPVGILRCQVNGLPHTRTADEEPSAVSGWSARAATPALGGPRGLIADTWRGVGFCPEEIANFAREERMQLVAMDGYDTQYLWVTMRKPRSGDKTSGTESARIVRITNTLTGDPVIPAGGCFASASLWMEGLGEWADLNGLRVNLEGHRAAPSFIGKLVENGPTQVNFYLPPGVRAGLLTVSLEAEGRTISNQAPMRLVPPGPLIPKLMSVTDGVNLLSSRWIESRSLKVHLEEIDLATAEEFRGLLRAEIDGREITDLDAFCIDPLTRRFEVNLTVPGQVPAGRRFLVLSMGRRTFPPVEIELAE